MKRLNGFYTKYKGSNFMFVAIIISLLTVIISVVLYIPVDSSFSIITHYLSNLGSAPPGLPADAFYPAAFMFNSGMTILVIFRVIIAIYLYQYLVNLGISKKNAKIGLNLALISSMGSLMVAIFPFSVSLYLHELGAMLLFIGTVFSSSIFASFEIKLKELPKYLPTSLIVNVIIYSIFAFLLFGGMFSSIFEGTDIIWEWLAFCASLQWLFFHGIYMRLNP